MTILSASAALLAQVEALAPAASAKDCVYLGKAVEAARTEVPAGLDVSAATNALLTRIQVLAPNADAQEMVYLGKAAEALVGEVARADVVAAGLEQREAVQAEGDAQIQAIQTAANALGVGKVKVAAGDASSGYLAQKIVGATVETDGSGNQVLRVQAPTTSDKYADPWLKAMIV